MKRETLVAKIRRVGIIGVGDQGLPIAFGLLRAGWPLAFHARKTDVIARLEGLGARHYSLAHMADACDLLLVVVVDDEQVRKVLVDSGLLLAMRSGSIVAVHSTVHPNTCRELAVLAEENDIFVIDAPVSGGRDRSYAGDLTVLAGGAHAAIDAARRPMSSYASTIVRMGEIGAGQTAKLINNYFYAAHLATAAKEIELLGKLGVDVHAAAEALPTCSGSSGAFAIQAARKFERTVHDKGNAHARQILASAIRDLRGLAEVAHVDLSVTDILADAGLAGEAMRDGSLEMPDAPPQEVPR